MGQQNKKMAELTAKSVDEECVLRNTEEEPVKSTSASDTQPTADNSALQKTEEETVKSESDTQPTADKSALQKTEEDTVKSESDTQPTADKSALQKTEEETAKSESDAQTTADKSALQKTEEDTVKSESDTQPTADKSALQKTEEETVKIESNTQPTADKSALQKTEEETVKSESDTQPTAEKVMKQMVNCSDVDARSYDIRNSNQTIENQRIELSIAKEKGDKSREARAYVNLGNAYDSLGKFKEALEYHKLHLHIAKDLGDRAGEARAYCNLGIAYQSLGNFKEALEYHKLDLHICKDLGDRAGEARADCNLGIAFKSLGNFKEALEYHKLDLHICKDLGDRAGEARAYGNLGIAYQRLGNFKEALEYHKLHLHIAKDLGDRAGEARAYGNLGNAYQSLGNFKEALEYHKLDLHICKDLGDRSGEASAYCNLGNVYQSLGNFKEALEYHKLDLHICKDLGDRSGEARAYCNLGNAYQSLGNFKEALEYHKLDLHIAKDLGDRAGEASAYGNLGNAYYSLGNFKEALEYRKLHLHISKDLGDRAGEARAYGNLGNAYYSLGNFKEALEYHKLHLHIARDLGDRAGEASAYGNLGNAYDSLGNFKEALEYHKLHLHISKDLGDRVGEAKAFYGCGFCMELLESLDDALSFYQSSIKQFNVVRSLLQSNDEWKISFRNQHKMVYEAFQRLLLKQNRIIEAFSAAEKARSQALEDLLMLQYGFETVQSDEEEFSSTDMQTFITSPVLYLAVHENEINMWIIQKGGHVQFRKKEIDFKQIKINEAEDLESFIRNTVKNISLLDGRRCEDRTLDELDETERGTLREETSEELFTSSVELRSQNIRHEHLSTLYDVTVGSVADLIHGNDLIIVPDGPMFLAPFAAFTDPRSRYLCESFTIRVLPSLTSLKLIAHAPSDYHSKRGALIVGDPCLKKIRLSRRPRFKQLPCARKEAEMIGRVLNTTPLTGEEATKKEVLKRLNTVALVHIAAHGDRKRGEIALSPDPDVKTPKESDYMLTMAEVLSVRLRAQLVVLSCCNSGRGKIKAEGVVGIVRAFLGAGARSVLVSLWAINEEATLAFMESFYKQLNDGKSASEALRQAMAILRESQKFNAVQHWAPFVLIGDDISLDFGENYGKTQKGD